MGSYNIFSEILYLMKYFRNIVVELEKVKYKEKLKSWKFLRNLNGGITGKGQWGTV